MLPNIVPLPVMSAFVPPNPRSFADIYIICGKNNLRYGINSLSAIIERQFHKDWFVPRTLLLFHVKSAPKIKGSFGRATDQTFLGYTVYVWRMMNRLYPLPAGRVGSCRRSANRLWFWRLQTARKAIAASFYPDVIASDLTVDIFNIPPYAPPPPLQFPQLCSTLKPLYKKGTMCEEEFQWDSDDHGLSWHEI